MNTLLINKIKKLYKEKVKVQEFVASLDDVEKSEVKQMLNAFVKINESDFIEILNDRKHEDEIEYELNEEQELELLEEFTAMSHRADVMSDNEVFDVLEKYDYEQRMFLISIVFTILNDQEVALESLL